MPERNSCGVLTTKQLSLSVLVLCSDAVARMKKDVKGLRHSLKRNVFLEKILQKRGLYDHKETFLIQKNIYWCV